MSIITDDEIQALEIQAANLECDLTMLKNYKFAYQERLAKDHFINFCRDSNQQLPDNLIDLQQIAKQNLVDAKNELNNVADEFKILSKLLLEFQEQERRNTIAIEEEQIKYTDLKNELEKVSQEFEMLKRDKAVEIDRKQNLKEIVDLISQLECIDTDALNKEHENLNKQVLSVDAKLADLKQKQPRNADEQTLYDLYKTYEKNSEVYKHIFGCEIKAVEEFDSGFKMLAVIADIELWMLFKNDMFHDVVFVCGENPEIRRICAEYLEQNNPRGLVLQISQGQ